MKKRGMKAAKEAGWVRSNTLLASELTSAIAALHGPSADALREDLNHPSMRFFNVRTRKFSGARSWDDLPT